MNAAPGLKVALVDDEPVVIEAVERYLRKRGCSVTRAENAAEAFSLLWECDPDVWVIDIKMPGVSGLRLAEDIRRSDPCAAIFLITGCPADAFAAAAARLGVREVFQKPIAPAAIGERLAVASRHGKGAAL